MNNPDDFAIVPLVLDALQIASGESVFKSYCFRHINGAIPTWEAMLAARPSTTLVMVDKEELEGLRADAASCQLIASQTSPVTVSIYGIDKGLAGKALLDEIDAIISNQLKESES